MPDIRDWLNKKFLEWQNEQGQPMTQKDFAAYLGVKPTTYSGWVNSGIPPTGDNLHRLASKLGYEIYEIVGVSPPSPIIQRLIETQETYNDIPPEAQQTLLEQLKIINDTYAEFRGKRLK